MKKLAALFVIVIAFMAFSPSEAMAQNNFRAPFDFQGMTTGCLKNAPAGVSGWDQKYSARLIYCMRQLLREATIAFMDKMVRDYALPTIGVVVIFAMAIFGIKTLGGMFRNPKAEAFGFFIKIGFIFTVLSSTTFIVDFWFDTTDIFINLIAAGSNAAFGGNGTCPVSTTAMGGWIGVWDRFDCIFGKFIGFGAGVAAGAGIVAIIGAAIFSGPIGIQLALMGLGAIVAFAQFLFRCVMVVLLSYGGLALMILMLPVFLPLILFKATERFFFDKWLEYAVGFVLQPALTIAFLFFALAVMDDLLMNGSTNTYVHHDPAQNKTTVKVLKPGETPPPNYVKAVNTIHDVIGFDPFAPVNVQNEQLKRSFKDQKQASLPVSAQNASAYSTNKCKGNTGQQNPSKDEPISAAVSDKKFWETACTDPKKCKEAAKALRAAQGNKGTSPSEAARVAVNQALCNYDPSAAASRTANSGSDAENMVDVGAVSATELDLNRPDDPQQTGPSPDSAQEKRLMQLIGSVGTILIMAGTFLSFANTIPGLVESLSGSPGQKLNLESPRIMGKKLSERLRNGMIKAHQASTKAFTKDSEGNSRGGFIAKAGGAALSGFLGGVTGLSKTTSSELKHWTK